MNVQDWYPFFVVEYRRDTYHLTAAQHGIYRQLIDEYMISRKPLPDHDLSLAGIARVSAQEWAVHREVVRAFFQARDGKLFHKRCEQELHAQRMRAAKRSQDAKEAATVRWAKEKQKQRSECAPHAGGNASAMRMPATLHNNKRNLTTSVVGERQLTPQERAIAELAAETLASPKAAEKAIVASPELIQSVKRRGVG
jgi:uncharacterized protein YdaU (DUF1376 family)